MPDSELVLCTSITSASVATLLIIAIFSVVVLPAVWSQKRTRRTAAAAVLQQILDVVQAWGQRAD